MRNCMSLKKKYFLRLLTCADASVCLIKKVDITAIKQKQNVQKIELNKFYILKCFLYPNNDFLTSENWREHSWVAIKPATMDAKLVNPVISSLFILKILLSRFYEINNDFTICFLSPHERGKFECSLLAVDSFSIVLSHILLASYYVIECYAVVRFFNSPKGRDSNEWAFELLLFCDRNFTQFDYRRLYETAEPSELTTRFVCVVRIETRYTAWPRWNVELYQRCSRSQTADGCKTYIITTRIEIISRSR